MKLSQRASGVSRLVLAALGVISLLTPAISMAADAGGAWGIDPAHTEINFSVKHFFTPVTGSFEDFEVDLDYNAKRPEKSKVTARIKVASINTGNTRRDDHLRSADWFEADAHPYITFESKSVESQGPGRLLARGDLTIKGQTREIELPITLLGTQPIPEKMRKMLGGTTQVASFRASTAVDRGDFGVGVGSWAATMVVGSEIKIEIVMEAHHS